MTQKERDRLVALKRARRKLITQKQAAEEIGISERQVRRLLSGLKKRGDKAVIHAARGKQSNRRIAEQSREKALEILRQDVYRGFGPTLAAEYLAKKHKLKVSRETVRSWMLEGKLWRARTSAWRKCISGGHAAAVWANWCSGTPASTIGWKNEGRNCI